MKENGEALRTKGLRADKRGHGRKEMKELASPINFSRVRFLFLPPY